MFVSRRWLFSVIVATAATSVFAASYIVPPDGILLRKADGIVIARATTSWVEESPERGIETVTEFSMEEELKGNLLGTFRIRVPGGKFGKTIKIVPGAPHFDDGERSLLFINKRPDSDDYITTDFGLGNFSFAYDDRGRHLAVRAEGEIFGWDLKTNQKHQEQRRDAELFIAYIRAIVAGRDAAPDYFVPIRPLLGKVSNATGAPRRVVPLACSFPGCTATSYTLGSNPADESSQGLRWAVFPTAVNWNQGNTESGAPMGGTTAINAAFSAWNGAASTNINYVLATSNANTNGITDAPDGVNNIVFEHNFGSDYVCGAGGLLGAGGVQTTSSTNMVGGETFFSSTEGDVSMNKGIAGCTSLFNSGDFNSAVTHEVGHTLGLRHADKNRRDNAACSTDATLECASSAIMTAVVTSGISATLQTWDNDAVKTLYPAPTAPPAVTSVVATATTSTNVQVSWSGSCATTCHIYRSADHLTYTQVGTSATSPFNGAASANTAYLYKVRAFNGAESADSNIDLATTVIYSNTITAGSSIIQAVDINELRNAVDAVRTLDGIGAGSYTFGSGSPVRISAGTDIHAADINELRTNLNTAYNGLFGVTPSYTNTITAGSSIVQAIDFNEIRAVMQ